jgi:RNA polymerase sigma factor (sigma-70 family)
MDQLLLPYLQASTESDREQQLQQILSAYAVPEVRIALRRRLSFFVDAHGKSPHNQDAEDLFQEIMTKIVQALHELKEPSSNATIEDVREYIARITVNCCNDILRKQSPSRTRLKYNLRFFLTHHGDFAVWKSGGMTLTGLAEWRNKRTPSAQITLLHDSEELDAFRAARWPGENIKQVPLPRIVGEIFRWRSNPIEIDELVSIVADIQKIEDLPTITLHEDLSTDSTAQAWLEGKDVLRLLWRALRELSREQRDVFSFAFEDERGRDLFTVLLETETVTFRELSQEFDRPTDDIVRLWSNMPMDNKAIAQELNMTRGRVYQHRSRALEKLKKGLLPFSGENKY